MALGVLLMNDLASAPRVIVLDREHVHHLRTESNLTSLDQALLSSVHLLEGGFRSTTDTNELAATISLRELGGGPPKVARCVIPANDSVLASARMADEITTVLETERPVRAPVDREAEASLFIEQARKWITWGDKERAIRAAETAYALHPTQESRVVLAWCLDAANPSIRDAIRANRVLLEHYGFHAQAVASGEDVDIRLPETSFWLQSQKRQVNAEDTVLLQELYDVERQAFAFRESFYRRHYDRAHKEYEDTWSDRLTYLAPYCGGDPRRQVELLREAVEAFERLPPPPPEGAPNRLYLVDWLDTSRSDRLNRAMNAHPRPPSHLERRELQDVPPLDWNELGPLFAELETHADPLVRFMAIAAGFKTPWGWWEDREQVRRWYDRRHRLMRILAEDLPPSHPYRKANPLGDSDLFFAPFLAPLSLPTFPESEFEQLLQTEYAYYIKLLGDIVSSGQFQRLSALDNASKRHHAWLDSLVEAGRLAVALELAESMVEVYEKNGRQGRQGCNAMVYRRDLYRELARDLPLGEEPAAPQHSEPQGMGTVAPSLWDPYDIHRVRRGFNLPAVSRVTDRSSLYLASKGNWLYAVEPILAQSNQGTFVDVRLSVRWLPSGVCVREATAPVRIPIDRTERNMTTWVATVFCMAMKEETAYVGTRSGLVELDAGTQEWALYTREEGLPGNMVRAVAVLSGRLYLAVGPNPYDHTVDEPAVFGRFDPSNRTFAVIASELAIEKSTPWDGQPFEVDDVIADEDRGCMWIKERDTGIWKYSPEFEELTNVISNVSNLALSGGKLVGEHINVHGRRKSHVNFVQPPEFAAALIPNPLGEKELVTESVAAVRDGKGLIVAGKEIIQGGHQRHLFFHQPGGATERLTETPEGYPFPGALHLNRTGAGILAVSERGHAFLIRRKADLEKHRLAALQSASGDERESALLDATDRGATEEVESLVADGVDINAKDNRGWTPLLCALASGHEDTVALLLGNGADPERANVEGNTPLIFAAAKDNVEVVREILARGVNADASPNYFGATPLYFAAEFGAIGAARVLIEAGANVGHHTSTGMQPNVLMAAALNGHLDCVELLLQHGALLEARDANGNTPLTYAANRGHAKVTAFLLNAGANPNAANRYEWTALMQATEAHRIGSVRQLVEAGADVNAVRQYGATTLMTAAEYSTPEIVQYLVDQGADPRVKASREWTALRWAEQRKDPAMIRIVRRALEQWNEKE